MPVFGGGLIYFYTGFEVGDDEKKYAELMAVDPDGVGDITSTHVVWRIKSPVLQLSTPLYKDGLLYTIDSKSTLMCLDAATGDIHYEDRLRGKFNASPVYAAGHVYCSNTNGNTVVFPEGTSLDIVAENRLEGEIWTTPAMVRNSIILRTSEFLYRIQADD
jgi:outer membrane protein assembly factor BamB